jgi:enoyl-CoA hydratase/carnithine racemase
MRTEYRSILLDLAGQLATIRIRHPKQPGGDIHWDLGEVLSDLRGEDSVRVIVLTGEQDGIFSVGPTTAQYRAQMAQGGELSEPHRLWRTFAGLVRCHEAITAIEKPVIARVNGEVMGFAPAVMFGCDFVIARKDARVGDTHLALAELEPYGAPFGIVPGDGGMALAPLLFAPTIVKEYLMLRRTFTGDELAAMHLINRAVEPADLDATVDDFVRRLLERPADALAWTKRVVNRRAVQQLNRTLDAGAAFEMVTFLQAERAGFVDRHEL